jgi:hypothetical protein
VHDICKGRFPEAEHIVIGHRSRARQVICGALAILLLSTSAFAQPAPAAPKPAAPNPPPPVAGDTAPNTNDKPPDPEEAKKEEARKHFESGLALFDVGSWEPALAEFLLSREIYPTRAATKNAAVCLRKLNRLDESLRMFERLLEMADLSPEDRQLAETEIASLRALVGTIVIESSEPGATVGIDGRVRGHTPLKPIRIETGAHIVRLIKEGFDPFEARIDLAGGQSITVSAKLRARGQGGWLKVVEANGRTLDVWVDGFMVGKTPWEAHVAPGLHTVSLRGADRLGTQPTSVPVKLNELTPVTLEAEELAATLRIEPTPAGASVAIDGVILGRGVWQGPLRAGAHRIEVAAEGFVPQIEEMTLVADKPETLKAELSRDRSSPMWTDNRGRIFAEADVALGLVPTFGGDVAGGCSGACSRSVGIGFAARGRGGYHFTSGLLLGVEAGYLLARQSVSGRETVVQPVGLQANPGTADDTLTLSGTLVGVSGGVRVGEKLPFTLRLGLGAVFGNVKDERTGSFHTIERSGKPVAAYSVSASESSPAGWVYIAPEARIGWHAGKRLELSAGVGLMVLVAPTPPRWVPEKANVLAATDGQGQFPEEQLTGKALIAITPGLGAKYEF